MTKSRLLVSLMVIALAAALIGGATMAWFTDEDEAAPVTFTAGTLLIDMTELSLTEEFAEINLDILNPGDKWEWEFEVQNVGTKSFNWGIYACWQDIIGQLNENLPEEMRDLLEEKGYGTNGLSEVLEWEVYVDYGKGKEELLVAGVLPEEGPIGAYMNPLYAEDTVKVRIIASLPDEAGNEYQGSKMNLVLGVMAWQTTNNAPAPTLEDVECPFSAEEYVPKSLAFGYQNNNWFMEIELADGDSSSKLTSFKASLYQDGKPVATNRATGKLFEKDFGTISTTFGLIEDKYWDVVRTPKADIDPDEIIVEFEKDGKKYIAVSVFRNDGNM